MRMNTPVFRQTSRKNLGVVNKKISLGKIDQDSLVPFKNGFSSFAVHDTGDHSHGSDRIAIGSALNQPQETIKIFLKKEDFFGNRQLLYTILPELAAEQISPEEFIQREAPYPKTSDSKLFDFILKFHITLVSIFNNSLNSKSKT